jgi:plasmid stabilization system protein ParE
MGERSQMNVIWAAASVKHLQEVVDYIQSESTEGAITTRHRILEMVRRVGEMPHSGRIGRVEGTREVVIPRSPYIVVYQLTAEAVEILGIWHSARQWPESF